MGFLYPNIKGIVKRDEFIFKPYDNRKVHALIVFTLFGFLVDDKIKLKVLACSFEITY